MDLMGEDAMPMRGWDSDEEMRRYARLDLLGLCDGDEGMRG